jgi:hypothetical protein
MKLLRQLTKSSLYQQKNKMTKRLKMMLEIENAPHKKHYYKAVQAAHEEFFVATNKQVDETF